VKNNSLIGRKLANFQIKSLLARGGMADVYVGIDTKLHRQVAIKVFEAKDRSRMAQANRFIQEARMMANWRHDNIIPIYYSGDETGLFYYVMELIDGYDLAAIMAVYAERGELMPTADVLRIGDCIANALDYAHAKGIIHRDVKPGNVMIANDGRVVLGDFGLALDLKAVTQGEVFGSPHYISPEQARRSSDAVPQSDLYSLGVILFEMLTGATPFNDPSPASLALQHITNAPPSPRDINPNLSEKVEQVLLKALEKKPKERYQSGKALMDALRKAMAVKSVAAPVDAPPLPPIPVNAPTIHRSNVSLNSFTKRGDVITALEKHSTTTRRGVVEDLTGPGERSKRNLGWLLLIGLMALALLGWWFRPDMFTSMFAAPQSSPSSVPSVLPTNAIIVQTVVAQPTATDTFIPEPTATNTIVIPTDTLESTATTELTTEPSATSTQTQTETAAPTTTATAIPVTASATSTAQTYPNGYQMTAFYNESSFYLLDKGKASRSLSGFVFERVNNDETFQNRFEGWHWETFYVKAIQQNRCVSLEIDKSLISYLSPVECANKGLSRLKPAMDADELFWTRNDSSAEFRVLWLNQEIARCKIADGVCDFRVP
jgi:serine/threonine protein kinase